MADPLSNLGNVILGASQTYANRRFQLDDEERQRANRQADVQNDREYTEGRNRTSREQQLEDEKRRRTDDLVNSLIPRYLALEDAGDPLKISAAVKRAQADGVIDRNRALIEAGLLKAENAGDPAAVIEALTVAGDRNTKRFNSDQEQIVNADAALKAGTTEMLKINARASSLEQQAEEILPEPLTAAGIHTRAVRIASQGLKEGEKASDKDIASAKEQAAMELQAEATQTAAYLQQQFRNQASILRFQATEVQKRLAGAEQRSGRFAPAETWDQDFSVPREQIQKSSVTSAGDVMDDVLGKNTTPPPVVQAGPSRFSQDMQDYGVIGAGAKAVARGFSNIPTVYDARDAIVRAAPGVANTLFGAKGSANLFGVPQTAPTMRSPLTPVFTDASPVPLPPPALQRPLNGEYPSPFLPVPPPVRASRGRFDVDY